MVPELTAVVVTPARFDQLRRTVRHLREQTAAARVELVIVAPSTAAVGDCRREELDGFASVQVVPAGPIPNVDKASAVGVRAATAPAVALIEDHAFCQPGWAAAIIEAHRRADEVIGSVILNGNRDRMLSWVNLLIAYGTWTDTTHAGAIDCLPGHNITYKRDVLLSYGDELPERLGRDGGLLDDLSGQGARFFLEPGARIAHVNPSILSATVDLRFNAGRLYGHMRCTGEGWSRRSGRSTSSVGRPSRPCASSASSTSTSPPVGAPTSCPASCPPWPSGWCSTASARSSATPPVREAASTSWRRSRWTAVNTSRPASGS